MADGENPYIKRPGTLHFDTDLVEVAHTRGLEIASRLEAGDSSPLPDEVISFLIEHTEAVGTTGIGNMRKEIADAIGPPPYTPGEAIRFGNAVRALIGFSNDKIVELSMMDETFAAQIRMIGERFQQPE